MIQRAENKEHALAGMRACVCVCVSFDSPKLLFAFLFCFGLFLLLFSTPDHREVQNISHSVFTLHELQ